MDGTCDATWHSANERMGLWDIWLRFEKKNNVQARLFIGIFRTFHADALGAIGPLVISQHWFKYWFGAVRNKPLDE